MRIDIISAVPELLESPLNYSIVKRARDKGLVEVYVHNLREYSINKHRRVDDYAFGFSAGMVLQIEPIDRIITLLKSERTYDEVIYTSPDGEKFDQKMANRLSMSGNLIILCGHYKGIDHRIREHLITKEITIGDYVLTGSELFLIFSAKKSAAFVETIFVTGSGKSTPPKPSWPCTPAAAGAFT